MQQALAEQRHDVRKGYLSVVEAATYTGLGISTLNHYRVEGGGPHYVQHKTGGRVLYAVADLDEWMNAQRRSSTADRGASK